MAVTYKDNSGFVREALESQMERALEAIGITAEGYAKKKCPVDTGLLRNSITHAVGGLSFSGSFHASYGSNTHTVKNKKTGKMETKRYSANSAKAGSVSFGSISGTVGSKGDNTVYIGTNVEYAPYVEMGHRGYAGKHFIRSAIEDHIDQYKRLAIKYLKDS